MVVTSLALGILVLAQPAPPSRGREKVISGAVVGAHGQPVAGAGVFPPGDGPNRTPAWTDDHSRFQLGGVNEGRAFVFAEKAGFRFQGTMIDRTSGPVTLTLTRTGEKPAVALRNLPP